MRRKDRQLTDKNELSAIIKKANVCRIAFAVDSIPYIVPMNFGFEWNENLVLYFHCAKEGKKLDLMKRNNLVAFEIDIMHELIESAITACHCGAKYESITGLGRLELVHDTHERIHGLDVLMRQYTQATKFDYEDTMLEITEVLKLTVTEISGKTNIKKQ